VIDDQLHRWRLLAVASGLVIVLIIPLSAFVKSGDAPAKATIDGELSFVGRETCRPCHEQADVAWSGSDHDLAMDVATDETVLGDFNNAVFVSKGRETRFFRKGDSFFANTQGADGEPADFQITHVFGHEPLQQYLIPFPGGRLQCLTIAWNSEENEWFDLYPHHDHPPDDWLHWTRAAQNWNGMCAECHSTNLKKGFDPQTRSYSTSWSEIDVSCEACHGPGSRYVAWAEVEPMAREVIDGFGLVIPTSQLTSTEQVELCAPCHSRRSELGDYNHSRLALLDHMLPSLLREGLYHADGQIEDEVYVWGSFTQSKMFHNDVRCGDCHDVHSLELRFEGNDLCGQCHRADVYDTSEHHFHKKTVDGKASDGALCIKCHMPETTYMVIDERADHSLRIPRPDLSLEIGTPNACNQAGCHADKSADWATRSYREWYGRAKKPHYGTTFAAARGGSQEAVAELIRLATDTLNHSIVRATALSLLAGIPQGQSTMAVALSDEEPLMRHTALMSITASSPEELTELVAPLLLDEIRGVRMQAAVNLADIPNKLLKPYQLEAREKALDEYVEAMQYSLDFSFAGHNLGNLFARRQQPDKAMQAYREAIAIDDLFYPAKVNLAVLLNAEGRNDEAAKLLLEVVESHPEQYEASYSLGLLLAEMGRYGEAETYLQRAAAGMPNHTRVRYNLQQVQEYLDRTGGR